MEGVSNAVSQEALGLAEALGDLYCKVACYTKALESYQTQVKVCSYYNSVINYMTFLILWNFFYFKPLFTCTSFY